MAKQKHHALRHRRKLSELDYLIYFFTFATPLFEVPQLIEIYANQSAQDVSLWTWSFFVLDNIVWIVYAIRRKLLPVFITSMLYEVFEVGILIGILLYG